MRTPRDDEIVALLKSCVVEQAFRFLSPVEPTVFIQIIKGLRQKRCLRIAYSAPDKAGLLEQTKLSPYRLVCSERSCCVVGRSSVHRKTCSFDIQSIAKAELLEDSCELPPKYRRLPSDLRS
jgi:predicted DNA-binding transcriptional regulator YafY